MVKKKRLEMKENVPTTWQEALEQFIWWKQAGGVSERTIEDYKGYISRFFKRYPTAFNENNLKKSVLEYMGQPAKPAYFNLKLIYLRVFFDWCVKEGIFEENPLVGIKKRKAEGKVVNLDEETLKKLIDLPNKQTFVGLRDYALILLTLDTGIRPNEAFSLLSTDINTRALEVYIRSEAAKTRTSRTLPISPVTAMAINNLISVRHSAWSDSIPIFCSSDGTPLNRGTWWERFQIYNKKLGVKIRPYDLRHAFALQFLRNGGHALALQRTMGHADLSITKRYVALTQQDLHEQHSIASPLNTLLPQKQRVRNVKKKR